MADAADLTPYPVSLKQAIIAKHGESLRYRQSDYHYRHTLMCGDVVFLAGTGARLVYDMLQVLFALHECYYVGDGNNLRSVATFASKLPAVEERITVVLQMLHDPEHQYRLLQELIADVLECATGVE